MAAAGRVVASIVERLVVVAVLYGGVRLLVDLDLTWHPDALRTTLVEGGTLPLTGDGGLLWLLASAAGWMVIGATVFHVGDAAARRQGTLTRA